MSDVRFSDIVLLPAVSGIRTIDFDPDLVPCSRSGSGEPQHGPAAGRPSPLFIGDGHKTTFALTIPVRGAPAYGGLRECCGQRIISRFRIGTGPHRGNCWRCDRISLTSLPGVVVGLVLG